MSSTASFQPLASATGKAVDLSMQQLWLTGQVLPAGARLVVRHVFRSAEDHPLEVIYSFPLPRDAALRSFRIAGENFESHSALKPTEDAVRDYEAGLAQGSLAAVARTYGDGVVNLTVGNLRPNETVTVHLEILCGVELRDDGFRFRFPFTLAPSYHARAKAALTAPGEGEMELPSDEFGDMILPRFREDASALHQVGFELTLDGQLALDEVGSPSHAVKVKQGNGRSASVALATDHDVPNRDLVLDARFQSVEPQVLAGRDKSGVGRFAAIVPSSKFGRNEASPRRMVILLDRSGSMGGTPIDQARKAIDACLGALSEEDSFGLVAFDHQVETFQTALVPGSRKWRDQAHEFLSRIDARGSTELASGFRKAAELLKGAGGDILIFTDGQVAGTEQILAEARSLEVRLHCLGIGSASQDRFLALLARETGGVSRFVTPRERVDLAAVDLFASVGRPLASGLKAGSNIAPEPPACVFAGTPLLLFGEGESIELKWPDGSLNLPVEFSSSEIADTVWLLQGARLITDWESRYPAEEALRPLEKRHQSRVSSRLRTLSQTYGLASREMSLVAVVARADDRAGELPETRVVPVGMPMDVKMDAYFSFASVLSANITGSFLPVAPAPAATPRPPARPARSGKLRAISRFFGGHSEEAEAPLDFAGVDYGSLDFGGGDKPSFLRTGRPLIPSSKQAPPPRETADDILLKLAARMESDGGMPGESGEARAAATAVALLAFLSQGHTLTAGAFRSHVARQVSFLKSLTGLPHRRQEVVAAVLALVHNGAPPAGEWMALACATGDRWKEIEALVSVV